VIALLAAASLAVAIRTRSPRMRRGEGSPRAENVKANASTTPSAGTALIHFASRFACETTPGTNTTAHSNAATSATRRWR